MPTGFPNPQTNPNIGEALSVHLCLSNSPAAVVFLVQKSTKRGRDQRVPLGHGRVALRGHAEGGDIAGIMALVLVFCWILQVSLF